MRGRTASVPDKSQLRRYVSKGLTQQQIADAWERDSGHRVTRSAIGMALARCDIESAHPRPRYEDMLPWTVADEHRMAWDARMLRLEGRRRSGRALSAREEGWLDGWLGMLGDEGAVVHYDPRVGFCRVPRVAGDGDIIRRPGGFRTTP